MNERIDYSTHVLVGVKKSGDMAVIAHWPRVPRQTDVDAKVQAAGETYVEFALCTPTSIITAASASPRKRPLWP
jgi:hypothetical protein